MAIKKRALVPSSAQTISERIKETREARGITASEFARLVGVTPTAVWNWEKNSITPRRPALEAIAKVLGVTTMFMLTGKDKAANTAPQTTDSVALIVEDARARLAQATGLRLERIKVDVHFTTD